VSTGPCARAAEPAVKSSQIISRKRNCTDAGGQMG
jgi:hypothetical protein